MNNNIMKKTTILLPLISTLLCSANTYADDMGSITPFVAIEGGYSRNAIDSFNFIAPIGTIGSTKTDRWYSGRLSGGMMNKINEDFGISGEIGWGYYGGASMSPTFTGAFAGSPTYLSIKDTITGFDALMGFVFTQPCYSLFIKAGALVENFTTRTNFDFPTLDASVNSANLESNSTQVLPEIKLGGSYNFNDNWAITAAYLHVVGFSPKITGYFNASGSALNSLQSNTKASTLDTVLFGIQYTI
ncbi:MAG: hypothetical protein ACHP65_03145 [Legionellales bacterium]